MNEFKALSEGIVNYHIQITVAYRRAIFEDDGTKILTRDYILAAARKHGIAVSAIGFGTNHCHVFTTACKNHSPAKVAQVLKGFSSHMMRKHHRILFHDQLWGDRFGTSGYFYRTAGAVNSKTVRHYVAQTQEKHWKVYTHAQKNLFEFAS